MKETIELDQKIRTKNLELTKALQNVDRLTSNNVDLNVKLNNYTKDIDKLILNNAELNIKLDDYAKEIVRLTLKIESIEDNE